MQICAMLALTALTLNGTWDFKLLPSETNEAVHVAWSSIEVPSNWEMKGFGRPRYGTDIEGRCISGEVGVYRRTFKVPRDWKGRIFLCFDGVMFGAAVTLNGRPAADFSSSYNRHEFDVTDLVRREGENEIVVRTHGFPKGAEFDTHDDWVLHGIFRDVTLVNRPGLHLKDWFLTTRLVGRTAEVALRSELSGEGTVGWRLVAPDGREVAAADGLTAKLTVADAAFWSAEAPTLYRLEIAVKDAGGVVTERLAEKVGLREVTWSGRVFRVNGRPVKLRGVDHHDISPTNGRAITAAEQRRDVQLMKAANVNFVRTSHYPPSPAFMDACDELGIYLMDEVPFGYGDGNLTNESYAPLLVERAELTLRRDRNRPSVVAWSVGNENPVTDVTRAAMRRVRELDPSRPCCFPMQPRECERNLAKRPPSDLGDLVNWHYPLICGSFEKLRADFATFDRPYVFGEYAHAYGTDFGYLEDYWAALRDDPAFGGGAVWMFQDQGILRKAADLTDAERRNQTWPDAEHVYDTFGSYGTDGVVYSDRTPQTCYYELRKVYAPVWCGQAFLPYPAGPGTNGWIAVENRYDQLDLDDAVTGEWQVVADRSVLRRGELSIPLLAPHERGFLTLPRLPVADREAAVVRLEVTFTERRTGRRVYEKCFVLREDFSRVTSAGTTSLAFDAASGRVQLRDATGTVVLDSPLLVRLDRRPMIAKDRQLGHCPPQAPQSVRVLEQTDGRLELAVAWPKASGRVTFVSSPTSVRVDYALTAEAEMKTVEAGLAFALPSGMRRFDWAGDGPYEAYPRCALLSDFGIWSVDRGDLYFPGNRMNVRLAVASVPDGAGVALHPVSSADVVFERFGETALIGHNAFVGGKGSKFRRPNGLRELKAGDVLSGTFELSAVPAARPAPLKALFGPVVRLEPFMPFHAVYDQSEPTGRGRAK